MEILIHNNGGTPYKVQYNKIQNVTVFKESNDGTFIFLKQWNHVRQFYSGIGVSVLFELDNPIKEYNDGLKTLIHIYNDHIIEFCINSTYVITGYFSEIAGSDVVYAHMYTQPGGLFLFDSDKVVNIKHPPDDINDVWQWYYKNYNVNTYIKVIDTCDDDY